MIWATFHSRGEVLCAVIDAADQRRDGVLPTDIDGVDEKFDSDLDLLGALQLRWHTGLADRIEATLADQPMDLESAVVLAWQRACADMPGIRAVIDHHLQARTSPAMSAAMTKAISKEHVMLAVMAGRGDFADETCAQIGAVIEERARSGEEIALVPAAPHSPRLGGLIDRLKAVIAA